MASKFHSVTWSLLLSFIHQILETVYYHSQNIFARAQYFQTYSTSPLLFGTFETPFVVCFYACIHIRCRISPVKNQKWVKSSLAIVWKILAGMWPIGCWHLGQLIRLFTFLCVKFRRGCMFWAVLFRLHDNLLFFLLWKLELHWFHL